MTNFSVSIYPVDGRCRYWAKIVRANQSLPMPETVQGAADISGNFLRRGEEEIMTGDVLFEGEAMHHRKARGWLYTVSAVTPAGALLVRNGDWREFKSEMKTEGGFDPMLLRGSGDLAACVRFAHIARLGGLQNLRARTEAAAAEAAIDAVMAQQQKATSESIT